VCVCECTHYNQQEKYKKKKKKKRSAHEWQEPDRRISLRRQGEREGPSRENMANQCKSGFGRWHPPLEKKKILNRAHSMLKGPPKEGAVCLKY